MRSCAVSSCNTSSVRLSGMETPVNSPADSLACATSMGRPQEQGSPRCSASISRAVRSGLYTTSSTPVKQGNRARETGASPQRGNMPTGVALTMTCASLWRDRFS